MDYTIKNNQEKIIKNYNNDIPIDICVTTYNRLVDHMGRELDVVHEKLKNNQKVLLKD